MENNFWERTERGKRRKKEVGVKVTMLMPKIGLTGKLSTFLLKNMFNILCFKMTFKVVYICARYLCLGKPKEMVLLQKCSTVTMKISCGVSSGNIHVEWIIYISALGLVWEIIKKLFLNLLHIYEFAIM